MSDYERLQRAYEYGDPGAGLLLEEYLRAAVTRSANRPHRDKYLAEAARLLVAAVDAGKAARQRALDVEVG